MKIMKLLICIIMLLIFACDSGDESYNAPTIGDLQGTWDITSTCSDGTYPDYEWYSDGYIYGENFIGCEPINECVDSYGGYEYQEFVIISGDNITWCAYYPGYDYEDSSTQCDGFADTFILSGNTITIFDIYDGESESRTISISPDGSHVTIVQTIAEYGCSATVTQIWTRQ